MNAGRFLGKRILRLGWLMLALIMTQFFISEATVEPTLSRTAPLPPLAADDAALQQQTLH
ncbi:MAG: hypothetical protein CMF73_08305 [Maricaulis sp.]|nr:hypothetical protein [Maricaulis sp.]